MQPGLDALIAATATFVASHILLASAPLRTPLAARLGERGFMLLYSAVALATFVWMIHAWRDAPVIPLWPGGGALAWLPVAVMPVALLLAVCAFTTASPTLPAGSEAMISARNQAPGIFRVTRHPFLWSVVLWASAHIVARGDLAALVMMGGLAGLAVAGMFHIDHKKETRLGAAWGPILMTTSILPFRALAEGRTRMDWAGIGWWRPLVAAALYIILVWLHPTIIGVPGWPA
ncbi:MAG: NnrU protein [Alphaproteobacteria bacterium]|nr:NnrU protein [Alphaproteobacteria bacterium]